MLIGRLVNEKLDRLEQHHGVKIILAVESGSRAWGFASPDSDYDVRFIYTRPLSWYLSVRPRRDVIECKLQRDQGRDFDISGWDLRKALQLLTKSNPPLIEWLTSPIVYRMSDESCAMARFIPAYFNPRSAIYHYLHMAQGNYREYLKRDTVRLKKYFYVLRPLLACEWIEATHTMPPVEFVKLVEASGSLTLDASAELARLLELKAASAEIADGPRIDVLNEWCESRLTHFSEVARVTGKLEVVGDDLDEFFYNTVS